MNRITIEPRADWPAKVEALGFIFHSSGGPYWNESAYYDFTATEIDTLESATNELFRLCLEAVERVIEGNLFARLHIPERCIPLIRNSWEREDLSLFGRFDLRFDGGGPPTLYEFNADTPTSLLEASVVQWDWLRECLPEKDQFNSIHEKLIARWAESGIAGPVHFACVRDHAEDLATTVYLEDTAMQAGIRTLRLYMDEIGWDGHQFVDLSDRRIEHLFKLYPWEWMMDEPFSAHLGREPWRVVEPAWKMVLSNKAILALLWKFFPEHPNLLPAYFTPEKLDGNYARKPLLGREGNGVALSVRGQIFGSASPEEPCVYQQLAAPPYFDGVFPVIGSWIVQDTAAGIGIREGREPVTGNMSGFVPHCFDPSP
jgi:glutathionylspermidine synthase